MTVSRRRFLQATGAGVVLAGVGGAGVSGAADDFDTLRARWSEVLTGGDVDASDPAVAAAIALVDSTAQGYVDRFDRSADRQVVFTDIPLTESAGITSTFSGLRAMAMAFATPGSRLHGDASLVQDVVAGLDFVNQHVYNDSQSEFDNWWDWEIGSAQRLTDTCVLVYDHLSNDQLASYAAAIDHFVPSPLKMINQTVVSTGANRTDLCQVVAIRGILRRDADKMASGRDGLSDVFAYVTTGDGYYRDGSFVQHTTIAYTGTYGVVLLSGLGKLIALLAGSAWEITDPDRQIVFDAVDRTYAPVIYDAQMMDFVSGRAVSRATSSDHANGHGAIETILRLAQGAPADAATRWRARCKGWLRRDEYDDYLANTSVARIALFQSVLANDAIAPMPEPLAHKQFANMDRVTHRRHGWAFAISMSSERISTYERMNDENLRGYHSGDGMTYLYGPDQGQYADAFWPTVDPNRLPGITVDTLRIPDPAPGSPSDLPEPPTSWVGGSALRDDYGAVGMEIAPIKTDLRGRKSWFCLDDRIVALGAGITAAQGRTIETVVDNRNLHIDGAPRFVVDGREQSDGSGVFEDPRWAHLAGVGGYVFLPGGRGTHRRRGRSETSAVHSLREDRTGSWYDINRGYCQDPVTRRFHTIWIDHGVDPTDATYSYLLLPTATVARTRTVAADPGLATVANSAGAQGIRVPRLGLTMVNFWSAGTVAGVTVDAPASVVVERVDGVVTVAASDPTHTSASLTIDLDGTGFGRAEVDDGVEVVRLNPPRLAINVSGAAGATRSARLFRR